MIDLLAMLALPTSAPGAPTVALEDGVVPADPVSAGDVADFASVLAQLVTPALPTPTPIVPATTTAPTATTTASNATTPTAPAVSAPFAPAGPEEPVGRVIAFIPLPRRAPQPSPTDAAPTLAAPTVAAPPQPDVHAAPVVPLTAPAPHHSEEAHSAPTAMPLLRRVTGDGVPAAQDVDVPVDWAPGVANTVVPEREGAPAPVDVPEPAPTELAHPATLGVLGPDWGDRDAQSRVAAHGDPVVAPTPDRSLQLFRAAGPETLQRMPEVVVPATPAAPTDDVAPVADVAPDPAEPVLPVAHVLPEAVDIPATRPTGDAAPDAIVAATAAPIHAQAAQHAAATTHTERPERDGNRPVRSVAAPLRHAAREAASSKDGEHTITIRLDPPELGTVRIRVEAHGEKVSVTLHTELAEAKTELQAKHRDIADILKHEGFTLDGFDVDTSDQRPQRDDKQQDRRSAPTRTDIFEMADQTDDGELRL